MANLCQSFGILAQNHRHGGVSKILKENYDLVNHNAGYLTAPATSGLLINYMSFVYIFFSHNIKI